MKLFHYSIIHTRRIFAIVILLYIIGLLTSCKSVQKTQTNKTETTTVKKSDSSSVKTYTVIDTTKTDSSVEITETTIRIDSIEYDYVPSGFDVSRSDYYNQKAANKAGYSPHVKAKGVTINQKKTKQAAITAKGQTTASTESQNNIKVDSSHAETIKEKVTVKKPQPFKTALTVLFIVVGLSGLVMIYVAYKKKRKQLYE